MGKRPNPDGWQGGSEDFTYLRAGMEGRIVSTDPLPIDERQNAVKFEDLGLNSDEGVW